LNLKTRRRRRRRRRRQKQLGSRGSRGSRVLQGVFEGPQGGLRGSFRSSIIGFQQLFTGSLGSQGARFHWNVIGSSGFRGFEGTLRVLWVIKGVPFVSLVVPAVLLSFKVFLVIH